MAFPNMMRASKQFVAYSQPSLLVETGSRSIGDDMSKFAQLYYASEEGKYSALVMMVKLGDAADALTIATVYGKFDFDMMGGSFNIPPMNSSSQQPPIMDTSVMQMTAFLGDAEGAAFFKNPDAPPSCDFFNYSFMTFDVKDGAFPLKPKGWKTGEAIPLTLNVANMKPLAVTDLSMPQSWCKDVSRVLLSKTDKALSKTTSKVMIGAAMIIGLLVIGLFLLMGKKKTVV
jgi:hypothetical protein